MLSQCHDFLSTHEPMSLFCTLSPIFSFLTVLRILQLIYMLGRICLSAYSYLPYFGIYLVELVRVLVGITVFWICSVLSFMN